MAEGFLEHLAGMKSPRTRASRLIMRRIIAAYINDSPLAHGLFLL